MSFSVNAYCFQTSQVELLWVTGVRLHNDLKLCMPLYSVGVVTVAAVVRTNRWLRVADIPWLWAIDSQECSWVHGSSTHLYDTRCAAFRKPCLFCAPTVERRSKMEGCKDPQAGTCTCCAHLQSEGKCTSVLCGNNIAQFAPDCFAQYCSKAVIAS